MTTVPRWSRAGLVGTVLVFVGVSVWWLVADSRILDWDSGRHIFNTWAMRDALGSGDLLAPITQDNVNSYPPLLYLVGALGMAIGGWQSLDSAVLAVNLVFVPLLALGCWGTARLAYGELAGVLAAVFALGAPMVISLFHLYMLDVPQAAMVAVAVWLLLASRRFEDVRLSALAGAAGAGALLLKPTAILFMAGPVLVMLVRGGWRQPGLVAFIGVGAVLTAPWYLVHLGEIADLSRGASTTEGTAGVGNPYITPPRFSTANAFWYGWNLLNLQLLAPLFAFFAVGTITAAVRWWRTRAPDDLTPELIVGGLVSYVGITFITLKDYRYSLSVIVYVAALGTAWVPALRDVRVRAAAAAALVLVAAVNLIGVSTATGSRVELDLDPTREPGGPLGERTLRIYSPEGYIANKPRDDGDVLRVMRDVKAEGFTKLQFEPNGDITFTNTGLSVFQTIAGLELPPSWDPTDMPPDVPFLFRRPPGSPGPEPCGTMSDDWGIYVVREPSVQVPFEDYENFVCSSTRR